MNKTVHVRVSRNVDTDIRIKVNNALVKEADVFICLGNEINLDMETDADIKIALNSVSYKRSNLEQKGFKRTCEVCFKPFLKFSTEM
jgi:hypothetical protein